MVVLGIAGPQADAAAAIAVDGRLVAAVAEESVTRRARAGCEPSGGFPFASAEACLAAAGLPADAVECVALAGDGLEGDPPAAHNGVRHPAAARSGGGNAISTLAAPRAWLDAVDRRVVSVFPRADWVSIDPLHAHAAQLLPFAEPPARVIVIDLDGRTGGTFTLQDDLRITGAIAGIGDLAWLIEEIASALGWQVAQRQTPGWHPAQPARPAADLLDWVHVTADGADPAHLAALRRAVSCAPGTGICVRAEVLSSLLEQLRGSVPGDLTDAGAAHVAVRAARSALAASLLARLSEVAAELVLLATGHLPAADRLSGERLLLAGSLFALPEIAADVRQVVGEHVAFGPCFGPAGLAIGAALGAVPGLVRRPFPQFAIGPAYSEQEVKDALDGCRLDYVYEPDAARLQARVSRLLSRGRLVAWFQGPMEFGVQAPVSRSILCDPSNRYARENVNRFLRHRPHDGPPPLAMLAEQAAECFETSVSSPFGPAAARVVQGWRPALQAAVDRQGRCRVRTIVPAQGQPLADLLQVHWKQAQVPGLLHVPLASPGEPVACRPRDAIAAVFGSAVDALVMERFLVMKDHWLLRSHGD